MKVIVHDLAIEYTRQGQGPVVLMLHGWGDTHRTFDKLVAELGSGRCLVRLDLPGFGGSEPPPEAWPLDAYVTLVSAFCEKLGLSSIDVLVGHSLGGRIAIKGVADGRLTPRRLVLIASAGIAKSRNLRNQAFKMVAKAGKVAMLVPPLARRLRRRLYARAGSDYLDAGPLRETFLLVIGEDLQAAAGRINIPTLLIWGDADTETPLADGRRLHRLIPGSILRTIPETGHFVHQQAAATAAEYIQEFIK